jgi:uncharacterized protein with FMN-binding domain
MKKGLVSFIFIGVFTVYALYQNLVGPRTLPVAPPNAITVDASSPAQSIIPTTPSTTSTLPPASAPKGQYIDGKYTGAATDAYYGTIQVQAVISGGKIYDVVFLQYPSDRSTSRSINGAAMPLLKQEAIAAQNANVDTVSGATDSSSAFRTSLASALVQAQN